ncbi:MAG: outer membrane beta-barrel domain-containing protein [Gammaproteobacteria bacterium]|nr:outer membrane beta-barrel domain-containing protein [Gammaproteobacteria bacterium]
MTQKIFLFATLIGLSFVGIAVADDAPESVIQPQIDRRSVEIARVNVDDIELGMYYGKLSVEDFGSEPVTGYRLAYHVTEDFFIEGTYGKSTVSDEAIRNLAAIAILNKTEVDLDYYQVSIGYNLFPGEVFLGKNWAMTSSVYLIGGVGAVDFNDEKSNAFNLGVGVLMVPSRWLTVRTEMRDLMFSSDLLGENELKHNFQFTLGLSLFF